MRENDGLVNVWQAHNLAYTPTSVSSLDTFLWGIGGEICRSFYGVPLAALARRERRTRCCSAITWSKGHAADSRDPQRRPPAVDARLASSCVRTNG